MHEDIGELNLEKKEEVVNEWVSHFGREGKVGNLDQLVIRGALEGHGANFDRLSLEGRQSLEGYSNKAKHLGMSEVWGEKSGEFMAWCEGWVERYESLHGKELPKIVFKSGKVSKTEGMRQFLGELTAYAAGCLSLENLVERQEARYANFEKAADQRVKLTVPGHNRGKKTGERPFAPASFPPEFPQETWDYIKNWKST